MEISWRYLSALSLSKSVMSWPLRVMAWRIWVASKSFLSHSSRASFAVRGVRERERRRDMTAQLPSLDARLDDPVAWGKEAIEEAWEMADFESDAAPALANSFQITDLQHWLDLCA